MDKADKPWRAMYWALLRRVSELLEDGEGWAGIEHPSLTETRRLLAFHNELWEDSQSETEPLRPVSIEDIAAALGVRPDTVYRNLQRHAERTP